MSDSPCFADPPLPPFLMPSPPLPVMNGMKQDMREGGGPREGEGGRRPSGGEGGREEVLGRGREEKVVRMGEGRGSYGGGG